MFDLVFGNLLKKLGRAEAQIRASLGGRTVRRPIVLSWPVNPTTILSFDVTYW